MSLVTRKPIFFGDATYQFQLTTPMILELERKTGVGVGLLIKRIAASRNSLDFRLTEVSEIIRLGLIGGGLKPERALELVETYVHGKPLGNSQIIAMQILEALYFGHDPNEDKVKDENGQA